MIVILHGQDRYRTENDHVELSAADGTRYLGEVIREREEAGR
jgi:hypothetical protein